ncbi:MAG: DUF4203 domain-containing protein [Anaerolineae bacterium]|nr:DUF4203 domain-containing protein [Anaerolineae bacterium]
MSDLTTGGLLVALILIAFGLLNCLAGYRIFRLLLGLYGLILGVIVGATIAGNVTDGETVWVIVGAIAGGLVGAALFVLLYFVGVFLVGAAGGVSLVTFLGGMLSMEMPTLVILIVAIAVGIIALIVQRAVLILATAFSGAWLAVSGVAALMTGAEPAWVRLFRRAAGGEVNDYSLIVLGAWLVLGVLGAVVQFVTTREGAEDEG